MSDDYGQKISNALQAVWQMHKDAANLLLEVDNLVAGHSGEGSLRGWRNIHGSFITSGLTYDIKRGYYMAEGLFRHYTFGDTPATSNIVRSITIIFFNAEGIAPPEPMLIGTNFTYNRKAPNRNEKRLGIWDGWDAYFAHFEQANLGAQLKLSRHSLSSRLSHIEHGTLLARKLYSIKTQADVARFCEASWLEQAPTTQ